MKNQPSLRGLVAKHAAHLMVYTARGAARHAKMLGIPVTGNPATEQNQYLIEVRQGGTPDQQGTWIHPQVAVNFGQWCSPGMAVKVSEWVVDIFTHGYATINRQPMVPIDLSNPDQLLQLLTSYAIDKKALMAKVDAQAPVVEAFEGITVMVIPLLSTGFPASFLCCPPQSRPMPSTTAAGPLVTGVTRVTRWDPSTRLVSVPISRKHSVSNLLRGKVETVLLILRPSQMGLDRRRMPARSRAASWCPGAGEGMVLRGVARWQ